MSPLDWEREPSMTQAQRRSGPASGGTLADDGGGRGQAHPAAPRTQRAPGVWQVGQGPRREWSGRHRSLRGCRRA